MKDNIEHVDFLGQNQGPPTRMTWGPRIATGLDTLKMSFWVDFSSSRLFESLERAKQTAQEEDKDFEPVDLGGFEFNVSRSGVSMFQYRLIRGDIRFLVSTRTHTSNMPNCRLEIGSVSCWLPGYNRQYEDFVKMVEFLGGFVVKERVSEVHLCVDLIGQDIKETPVGNMDYWITRAVTFSPHFTHRKLTGVSIGSGDMMLRVYDKIQEMKTVSRHKIEPFMQIWEVDSIEDLDVTRVEFQVRRSILKEFKFLGGKPINTLNDLNNSLSSLWSYLINDWARLTSAPVDREHNHQSRAESHSIWQQLKKADFSGLLHVVRSTVETVCDMESLRLQMAGLGMSLAAAIGRSRKDVEQIIASAQGFLEGTIRRLFREDEEDFAKRMDKKHNRLRLFADAVAA
ncbi:hypothetical protein ACUUL3_04755 [Thiovibrio sp. JS02]